MKDSTIFKLAAGAGLLAFVGRLLFVQPDDLGVRRGVQARAGDEINRLALLGDYPGAIRVASVRQREDYLDQGGWSRIARLLDDALEHEGRPFDAREALEVFAEAAPSDWVEETGALGWTAYFVGFQAGDRMPDEASAAWRIGAEAFERVVREQPSTASAWDWLYRARTYMRLGENESARQALRDASNWVEAAIRDLESNEAVEDPANFLRTYGRTWAVVGGVQEAEAIWSRTTEAMLEVWPPIDVAENWRRYASNMYRSDEDAAGELALEMCLLALASVDESRLGMVIRAAPLWRDAAERFERREQHTRAEEAWARAMALQSAAAEETNDPSEWTDYAEMLATRVGPEPAYDALERAVAAGFLDPDRLMSERAFESMRGDDRFLDLVDRARQNIEAAYAPARLRSGDTPSDFFGGGPARQDGG